MSLFVEQFDKPASARDAMALGAAAQRAGDVLAGRTIWCVIAMPGARRSADALRARVDGAGPGVAATSLQLTAAEPLRDLARQLEQMLGGVSTQGSSGLGPAEREAYARGALDGDDLLGDGVQAQDVVVVHDALSALVSQAARQRGAHVVWRFRVASRSQPARQDALQFLQRFTPGVDAHVTTWLQRDSHGELVQRVAAALPAAGMLATKQFRTRFTGEQPRRLAWRMVLAEVVRSDRGECVGGTLHPRPSVAAR
ncbi:MAG TPA: hypothetical protein VGO29_09295 [Solirubrobacteraceae bacterium]|nr:hypothetical protein [Solirubrobacteraceae bacterium]